MLMKAAAFRLLCTALALLSLAGCGSLMQVHLDPPPPPALETNLAGQLGPALQGAYRQRANYLSAVANQSIARNAIAITTVPAAAAGLALGIANPGANATRNAILGIAAGSATALGLGSLLIEPSRNPIYEAGAAAVTCAIEASSPYRITMADLQIHKQDVANLRSALSDAAAVGIADLAEASSTLTGGDTLIADIEDSGPSLDTSLNKIAVVVSSELNRTEPDLNRIKQVIVNLPAQVSLLGTGMSAGTSGGKAQSGIIGAADAQYRLRQALVPVKAWISAVNVRKGRVLNASQCTVSVNASERLTLEPDTVLIARGGQATMLVHGLSGPDMKVQVGGSSGIKADPIGSTIVLTAEANALDGARTVEVIDLKSQQKQIGFVQLGGIVAASGGFGTGKTTAPAANPRSPETTHPKPLVAEAFGKTGPEFAEMLAAFDIDPHQEGARFTGWNAPAFKDLVRTVQKCMQAKFPAADTWGAGTDGKFNGVMTEKQFRFWLERRTDCPPQRPAAVNPATPTPGGSP
jgi:hypothetical protein